VLCAAFWVSSALFFFLIRPPPSSTLFPYTTLFRSLRVQSTDEMRVITAALHRRFDPEFINRIDRILNFQRIGAEHLQDLLDIELAKLNQRLGLQGRSLVLTTAGRQLLCARYDAHFGDRKSTRLNSS